MPLTSLQIKLKKSKCRHHDHWVRHPVADDSYWLFAQENKYHNGQMERMATHNTSVDSYVSVAFSIKIICNSQSLMPKKHNTVCILPEHWK
jgi:hypothetical protein